jgi:Ser/Thr protein kinase RdoA (MazF antagonist)
VRRFGTGSHHYVFEAMFEDRPAVVVRIAAGHSRSAMAGALRLSRLLRPQGVPLPEIIAERLNHQFPHLVLGRLPGTDLGEVIRGLSDSSLEAIAAKVARAQWVTAKTASSGRYGYGVASTNAPHDKWSRVLQDNLARSRSRIAVARAELDSLPPTPFLHDTTTKNVIVTSAGAFSGIVDVDDLCFGDPRYVVALTLASLTASGGPVQYIDAWMNCANYRSDRIFRLYVALSIVDFMSEHGQVFNGNLLPSSADDRNHLLRVFAECLRLAAPGTVSCK